MPFDGNTKPIGAGSLDVTEEAEDLFKNAKIEGDVGWRVKVGEDIVTDKEWVQGYESEWGLSANVKGKYVLLTFEAMYETDDELEENYWTTHVFKNRELVLVPVDDTPIDIDGAEMTIAADEVLINPNGFNTDNDYGLTVWSESFFRLSIEPVEVKATDAFRAAVAKVAPKATASDGGSSGGGTGGGVLVVTDTDGTLDKTFKEINDAYKSGVMPVVLYNGMLYYLQSPPDEEYFGLTTYAFLLNSDGNQNYYLSGRYYTAESANDYPVYDP